MKERIEQLAVGSVTAKQPELDFSPAYLEGQIEAGVVTNKELVIRVKNKIPFKSFFYSTNERVKIGTKQAAGQSAAVLFEINTIDLNLGDEIDGAIIVVGNAGEFKIPYHYCVSAGQATENIPQTIEAFTQLYKENPSKARALFQSEQFKELLFMKDNISRIAMYEGMLEGCSLHQALESFEIALGQKEQIVLKTDIKSVILREEDIKPEGIEIILEASTWGWAAVQVSSDMPWLVCSKKKITSKDFCDNKAVLRILPEPLKMHRGRNAARLFITSPTQTLEVLVQVIRPYKNSRRYEAAPKKSIVAHLYRLMLAYINESHEEALILSQMDQCIEETIKKYPSNAGLHLYRVWLLAKQGRSQEAKKLLTWYYSNLTRSNGHHQEEYVMILYLQYILTRKEEDRLDVVNAAIELQKNSDSIIASLTWLMTEENISAAEKLRHLERMYRIHGAKPVIYACAAKICRESPDVIKKNSEFWMQLLSYMLRYGCITQEIVQQYLRLQMEGTENPQLLYQVMKRMYQYCKDDKVLTLICGALIRMGKTSPAYASWFEQGINRGITLTGLNDAFMTSVCDEIMQRQLPAGILLYYSFKNDLDNRTRLNLYTYILEHFPKGTDMYQAYEPQMDDFAIRQLLEGRINAKLVPLYDNLLTPGLIDEHLGHVLTSLLFSKQISCKLPYAKKIVIHYAQLKTEQSARLIDGDVCIPIYAEDAAILFEDAYGNRYADADMKMMPLMYREDLTAVCRQKVPGQLMLMVQEADKYYKNDIENASGMKLAFALLDRAEVKAVFKKILTGRMVDYCFMHHDDTREYDAWLVSINPKLLKEKQRCRLIEMCILRGYQKEAFEMTSMFSSEGIRADLLLKMTVRRITESLYEYNEALMAMCVNLLKKQQVHETMMRYLCMHFEGPTEEMYELLIAADKLHADSADLSARTVTQMLFTGKTQHLDETYEICTKAGCVSEKLARAVLVVKCHDSLVKETQLSDDICLAIEKLFEQPDNDIPEVFSLALLQQYSNKAELSQHARQLCERLLYAYCAKGVYMKCFHGLKKLIELPHQMEGRIIIQWNGKQKCHARVEGELLPRGKKVSYEMQEVYPGIYTAGVFLFPDETVKISVYCIEDEQEEKVKEVLLDASSCYCRDGSIYGEIQKLIELEKKENYVQWKQECIKAIRNREAAKELFTLL